MQTNIKMKNEALKKINNNDFALVQLKTKIKMDRYPILYENLNVIVGGFPN